MVCFSLMIFFTHLKTYQCWSILNTHDTGHIRLYGRLWGYLTCCKALGRGTTSTCFIYLGISQQGLEPRPSACEANAHLIEPKYTTRWQRLFDVIFGTVCTKKKSTHMKVEIGGVTIQLYISIYIIYHQRHKKILWWSR